MTSIIVHWTARLAVLCWLGRWVAELGVARSAKGKRSAQWLWTIGCGLYLLHVVSAFALVHHWSHSAAYEHTARQTRDVIGINWGGGLWFNYLFTLLWVWDADVIWRGRADSSPPTRRNRAVNLFLTFIVLNATLVFGPPWWWFVFGMAGLLVIALRRRWLSVAGESTVERDAQ